MSRNNWNFSHVVTARSSSFGTVDHATTGRGMSDAERAERMAEYKRNWLARTAEVRDGTTGQALGWGGALSLWEELHGK